MASAFLDRFLYHIKNVTPLIFFHLSFHLLNINKSINCLHTERWMRCESKCCLCSRIHDKFIQKAINWMKCKIYFSLLSFWSCICAEKPTKVRFSSNNKKFKSSLVVETTFTSHSKWLVLRSMSAFLQRFALKQFNVHAAIKREWFDKTHFQII